MRTTLVLAKSEIHFVRSYAVVITLTFLGRSRRTCSPTQLTLTYVLLVTVFYAIDRPPTCPPLHNLIIQQTSPLHQDTIITMETIASLDATVGALATLPGAPLAPTNLDVQAQDVLNNATTTVEDAAALAAVALVTTAIHQHKRSLSQAAMGLVFELATQLEIERTLVVEGTVEQPLKKILQEHLVEIQAAKENGETEDITALQGTLGQLEALIQACTNEYPADKYLGRAPGFWTRPGCPQGGHLETEWKTATTMLAYQTINCLQASAVNPKDGLPLPSPACAREVYVQLQLALQERLAYLCDKELEKAQNSPKNRHRRSVSQEYCSCVTTWWKGQTAPRLMVNQVMEGAMVQEASEYLSQSENFCLPQWDASYHPVHNNISGALGKDLPLYTSPMRLISNRDVYTQLLVQALLAARTSVMISTCYLFYQDPVQKYVLLDILPYIASRGVKVFFMVSPWVGVYLCHRCLFCLTIWLQDGPLCLRIQHASQSLSSER
jgi:hypothetical protein